MSYDVKVLADSMSPDGLRLTTMVCQYPRFIHAEMLRHRVMSHAVASSRAIPPEKIIERVQSDPFVPSFNKRVKGMGVGDPLDERAAESATAAWKVASYKATQAALALLALDVDKSRINRLLEPYLWLTDLITATEWDNFFALRDHPGAQPEFQIIACMMRVAMEESEPKQIPYGHWHLPFVDLDEMRGSDDKIDYDLWKMVSAGRCARVSYDRHDGEESPDESRARAVRLLTLGHMSPFEHVARPVDDKGHGGAPDYGQWAAEWTEFVGNFRGWVQMRKELPNEDRFDLILADRQRAAEQ